MEILLSASVIVPTRLPSDPQFEEAAPIGCKIVDLTLDRGGPMQFLLRPNARFGVPCQLFILVDDQTLTTGITWAGVLDQAGIPFDISPTTRVRVFTTVPANLSSPEFFAFTATLKRA